MRSIPPQNLDLEFVTYPPLPWPLGFFGICFFAPSRVSVQISLRISCCILLLVGLLFFG